MTRRSCAGAIPRFFTQRSESMSRILLVDDDASLLKLMSMRLRSQGYEVDTADSAEGRWTGCVSSGPTWC